MDKMSQNKQKKIETVGILEEKVRRAKGVVLTDYKGLTHQQLEALKKNLKTVEAELVVTKNTLMKRAIQNTRKTQQTSNSDNQTIRQSDISESPKHRFTESSEFSGPTAALFAYGDIIAPLKELAKMIKLLKLPTIKLALLDGKMLDAQTALRLAALPSREVLIAQVVGGMKAPIYGLHRALSWNLQKLVMTLKAIESKKQ